MDQGITEDTRSVTIHLSDNIQNRGVDVTFEGLPLLIDDANKLTVVS